MHENLLISLVLLLPSLQVVLTHHENEVEGQEKQYRICVPDADYNLCLGMVAAGKPRMGRISCVHAPDKIACMEKILKREADFIPLEAEEIYLADRLNPRGFVILGEIRSGDYSTRDFRYESVAVVRISSGINSISSLKGKRSCHTGFGRNSGWRIPFSHLMDHRQLSPYCDKINASNVERDLYAVSNYFEAACAPGPWAADKEVDKRLKETYSSLCSLCKDPSTCGKKDEYGKYEGALRCLTENDGDVAFTKLDAVEEFFKLKEETSSEIVGEYQFLCGDDTTLPLTTETPCSWAKRPWKAFVTSRRIGLDANKVKDLRDQLTLALYTGSKEINPPPEWLTSVLEFNPTDVANFYDPYRVKTITPSVYLAKRNFTVTFEKPSCPATSLIRFCVQNEVEGLKCNALRLASESQRISPGFSCVSGKSSGDCTGKVSKRKGDADVVVLPYAKREIDTAQGFYQLVPILSEVEVVDSENTDTSRYSVAVIRSELSGEFTSISNLRGRPSCHGSMNSVAGWSAPLSVLVETGEINVRGILETEMLRYFGNKTCVPGAKEKGLCSLCAGDGGPVPGKPYTPETVCADDDTERYYGDLGVLRCLQDKVADVAFLDHVGLHQKTKGTDLNLGNLRLLCRDGTVTELDRFEECNWGRVPAQKVMARGGNENVVEREDFRLSLLKAQKLFGKGGKAERVFKLFGVYYGNENLLFQDTSVGLAPFLTPVQ
ncbi:Transferrin [Orchesella cincta]|uniref:Transferrin n=1 Tax=Orchesella cincta TaxID=48709 RepID=A0A1D2MIR3_ORCCI|nr:Transferrin [Orchesella cincta]